MGMKKSSDLWAADPCAVGLATMARIEARRLRRRKRAAPSASDQGPQLPARPLSARSGNLARGAVTDRRAPRFLKALHDHHRPARPWPDHRQRPLLFAAGAAL